MIDAVYPELVQTQPIRLNLVCFEGVERELSQYLVNYLSTRGFVVDITPHEHLPSFAFNQRRQKYVADDLLSFLREYDGDRVLGLMNDVMYRYVLDHIKGMADFLGRAAVISLSHIREHAEQELLKQRLGKLAAHELGHTFGLEHCKDPKCVMNNADGLKLWDCCSDCYCQQCLPIIKRHFYSVH